MQNQPLKRGLSAILNVVLVVCAVALTALVVRREIVRDDDPAPSGVAVGNWRDYAATGQRTGDVDAPVTLVVFSDFQCPACKLLAESLDVIGSRNPRLISVVYRHYPLPIHPYAVAAARASECAGRQGRFAAFHDALYREQHLIGDSTWAYFASRSEVTDLGRFERCTSTGETDSVVERDITAGKALAVHATPTVLVNGRRLDGVPPLSELEAIIREAERTK